MNADVVFRSLRDSWFLSHLSHKASDGHWETEEQEQSRLRANAQLRAKFDEDTEAILQGLDRNIAPECAADVFRDN